MLKVIQLHLVVLWLKDIDYFFVLTKLQHRNNWHRTSEGISTLVPECSMKYFFMQYSNELFLNILRIYTLIVTVKQNIINSTLDSRILYNPCSRSRQTWPSTLRVKAKLCWDMSPCGSHGNSPLITWHDGTCIRLTDERLYVSWFALFQYWTYQSK